MIGCLEYSSFSLSDAVFIGTDSGGRSDNRVNSVYKPSKSQAALDMR